MSKRVYKNAWKEKDCLDYMEKNKGTEFDPDLVDYFFDIYGTIKSIQNKYQEH